MCYFLLLYGLYKIKLYKKSISMQALNAIGTTKLDKFCVLKITSTLFNDLRLYANINIPKIKKEVNLIKKSIKG